MVHFCWTRPEEVRQTWRDEPETSSEDHFNKEMIGAARNAKTYPQVKLPVRAKIIIDGWHDLLLLQIKSVKTGDRS